MYLKGVGLPVIPGEKDRLLPECMKIVGLPFLP